jgi:hypothetical protein
VLDHWFIRRRRDTDKITARFAVFKTVCYDTKRKSLNLCLTFFRSASISENPREVNDVSDPATILLLFNFHSKLHVQRILSVSVAHEKDRN